VDRFRYFGLVFLVFLSVGSIIFTSSAPAVSADESVVSDWLINPPVFEEIGINSGWMTDPLSPNRDCSMRTIIVQPKGLLGIYDEKTVEQCMVDTMFGSAGGTYLQLSGTHVAGQLKTMSGATVHFMPIPRSHDIIILNLRAANGVSASIVRNVANHVVVDKDPLGRITYRLKDETPKQLIADKSGTYMQFRIYSASFSANGRWMVVNSSHQGTYRVNLETLDVVPFGSKFTYGTGFDPSPQTAVSNDGRYAVLTSRSGNYNLFDLTTCAEIPDKITGPVSCNNQNLLPQMNEIAGFAGAIRWRFIGQYSMKFIAAIKQAGGSTSPIEYTMTADGHDTEGYQYLALGDSFASGEGAGTYKETTDTSINRCHLSKLSYPYLIGEHMDMYTYESVACSGAIIEDILNNSGSYPGQVSDNIEREFRDEDKILKDFLPGYLNQLEFLNQHRPSIITISTVGNDIGFGNKIKRCLESDTCFSSYEDRLEIVRHVNNQFYRLTDMYTQIKDASSPKTKVYTVGYPKIGQEGGFCHINVRLDAEEIRFANLLASYLNTVIRLAAEYAGVHYVDVEDSLDGYQLCSSVDPDEMAINGVTVRRGASTFDVITQESFHPTAKGHQLMMEAVMNSTADFTAPMPAPNRLVRPPTEEGLAILEAPVAGRTILSVNYDDDLTNDIIFRQTWRDQLLIKRSYSFQPESDVEVVMFSEPTSLGKFKADAEGGFQIPLSIPDYCPARLSHDIGARRQCNRRPDSLSESCLCSC
jgi:lysophospholipase L1-like esterase